MLHICPALPLFVCHLAFLRGPRLTTIGAVPNIVIHLDRAVLEAALAGHVDNEDSRSYAPSGTSWRGAMEAAERLGWRLAERVDAEHTSLRSTAVFNWTAPEPDSASQDAVVAELTEQLGLPDYAKVVPVERKIIVKYEGQRANKRTKLTCKTDYVCVLVDGLQRVQLCPSAGLQYVVNFFETKTTSTLTQQFGTCRGAAAVECLAANLSLLQDEVQMLPEGLPVVLTDMNTFLSYMRVPQEEAIEEVQYQSKAVAYDKLSVLLQQHAQHVQNRHLAKQPAAAVTRLQGAVQHDVAAAEWQEAAGVDAVSPSTMTAELQAAEVADAARNIAAQLKVQPENTVGVKVYVEEIGAAVARALCRHAGSSSSSNYNDNADNEGKFVQVPAEFAHLYS